MAISIQQRISIAAVVLVGLLAGAAVLLTDRSQAASGAAPHAEEAAHAEHEDHAGEGDSHDEREVELTEAQVKAAGIAVQTAGPGRLQAAAEFQGEIKFNEDRTAHVVPRVSGVAHAVLANLGQTVQQGQPLAVVASSTLSEQRSELLTAQKRHELARGTYEREKKLWQDRISAEQDYLAAQGALHETEIAVQNATHKLSAIGASGASAGLNRLEIRAPFNGTVVEKHLSLGEAVKEDASIFTISDLGSVWAEFAVAPKDLAQVRVGQRVIVSSTAFEGRVEGSVSYVGALLGEQTRTARARVILANPQGAWRPGLFVTVAVLGQGQQVPLVVNAEAVQNIEQQSMLFVVTPEGFTARPVRTGRSDGRVVEVLSGLKPGDRYAATNSFVLKSELGKASAEHAH